MKPDRRAKFWLKVFNDLKTRGCQDILIAVVDGLKGLGEAIHTVYPRTTVQTCIVHLIRNGLDYAGWKDRKLIAQALRPIYTAVSEEAAQEARRVFAAGPWGAKYPSIAQSWQRAWEHVVPCLINSRESSVPIPRILASVPAIGQSRCIDVASPSIDTPSFTSTIISTAVGCTYSR